MPPVSAGAKSGVRLGRSGNDVKHAVPVALQALGNRFQRSQPTTLSLMHPLFPRFLSTDGAFGRTEPQALEFVA